jgi:dehydrogenase/reductase SDR family member 1
MSGRPLEGRVAVVAGASRSIGMGIAVELGAAGAFVYALGRTLEPRPDAPGKSLTETVQQIEALGGRAAAVVCDCTDDQAVAAVMARVEAEQGRLDVLVNSVFSAPEFRSSIGKRFWEVPPSLWRDIVEVGVKSSYVASYHAAPLLIATAKRQAQTPLIVNVSGRAAILYWYNVLYGVGKAATERLTRDCAIDLKDQGVAVASIWPNGHPKDKSHAETPRYNGRAVAALAADPAIMARTGGHFWTAQLAADYGFTDELGRSHEIPPMPDAQSVG